MEKAVVNICGKYYSFNFPEEKQAFNEKLKYAFDWYTLKNVFYDDDRTDYIFKG